MDIDEAMSSHNLVSSQGVVGMQRLKSHFDSFTLSRVQKVAGVAKGNARVVRNFEVILSLTAANEFDYELTVHFFCSAARFRSLAASP